MSKIALLIATLVIASVPALAQMQMESSIVMPGVSTGSSVVSFLRFANADGVARSASVMLHDAKTGEMLATWTSPLIPAGGTLEISLYDILGASAPVLRDSSTLPSFLNVGVSGFNGHVQHAVWTPASNAWTNLSTCGMAMMADALSLPYVSGPARAEIAGFLRITNTTTTASPSLRLSFSDNAGRIYVWQSPPVGSLSTVITSMADITMQASPPIAADVRSMSVMSDAAPVGINLSYIEGMAGSQTMGDFSAACMTTNFTPVAPGGITLPMPGMTDDMSGMMGMGMMMSAPAKPEN